jgi:hypothetical protein
MSLNFNDVDILVSVAPFLTRGELEMIRTDANIEVIERIKNSKIGLLRELCIAIDISLEESAVYHEVHQGGVDQKLEICFYEIFCKIQTNIYNLNNFSNILNLIRIFNLSLNYFQIPPRSNIPPRFRVSGSHPYINILMNQFILVAKERGIIIPDKSRILSTIS